MTSEITGAVQAPVADAPDDGTLFARWQADADQAALADLISRNRPMVEATCRRILVPAGAGEDLDDAVQETFIALSGRPLAAPACISAWLRTVAVNQALMRLRARRRRRRHEQAIACEPPAGADPAPGREEEEVLDACVAQLDERDRDLIVRLFFAGESQAEVARSRRSSRAAVNQHLRRVLADLRLRLARRGLRVGTPALLLLLAGGDRALAAVLGAGLGIAGWLTAPGVLAAAAAAAVAAATATWWVLADPPGAGVAATPPAMLLGPAAASSPAAVPARAKAAAAPAPPPATADAGGATVPAGTTSSFLPVVAGDLLIDVERREPATEGLEPMFTERVSERVPLSASPLARMLDLPLADGPLRVLLISVPPGCVVGLTAPGSPRDRDHGRRMVVTATTVKPLAGLSWTIASLQVLRVAGRGRLIELTIDDRHSPPLRRWRWNQHDEPFPSLGTQFAADTWVRSVVFSELTPAQEQALIAACPTQQGLETLASEQ